MSALKFGAALGRGLGKVANVAWNGTVIVAGMAGDAGEGFIQGSQDGWESQQLVMDTIIERREANKAKILAARERARELAAPMAFAPDVSAQIAAAVAEAMSAKGKKAAAA